MKGIYERIRENSNFVEYNPKEFDWCKFLDELQFAIRKSVPLFKIDERMRETLCHEDKSS